MQFKDKNAIMPGFIEKAPDASLPVSPIVYSNFITNVRSKLMNIYRERWLNDVSSQSKLSNYKLLKEILNAKTM